MKSFNEYITEAEFFGNNPNAKSVDDGFKAILQILASLRRLNHDGYLQNMDPKVQQEFNNLANSFYQEVVIFLSKNGVSIPHNL